MMVISGTGRPARELLARRCRLDNYHPQAVGALVENLVCSDGLMEV